MKVKPAQKGRVVVELDPRDERLLADSVRPAPSPFQLKHILVPTDFSACSRKALQYAVPLARQFNARITLLHVVQMNFGGGEFGIIDYPLLENQLRDSAEKQLSDLEEHELDDAVTSEALVSIGQPVAEIVELARRNEVDLIIIATHGHTGLKHVLLGSIAENVVRHAPCPVLTVREHEHDFVGTKGH